MDLGNRDRPAVLAWRSILSVGLIALAGGMGMPPAAPLAAAEIAAPAPQGALAQAVCDALQSTDEELRAFYRDRGCQPLWIKGGRLDPSAAGLLETVRAAADDGLDPASYGPNELASDIAAAQTGGAPALAAAEVKLTSAAAAWFSDLHRPVPAAEMIYAEPAAAPPRTDRRQVLQRLAAAPSLAEAVADLGRMNPRYEALRAAHARARRAGDLKTARMILSNLERARALPADLGTRHVLVDITAQELELWDGGRLVLAMPVVVGRPDQPTPSMSGLMRFLVLNPYWHMPPDLAAGEVAQSVLRTGPAALDGRDLELVSEFSPAAKKLDPVSVNWEAVAGGKEKVYLRQRPGPGNMMGKVKFIFPNELGIYLHDTPIKATFDAADRAASAGCVRLADAAGLARALLGPGFQLSGSGAPEEIVELDQPVPVYLVYFTVEATPSGLAHRPDIYRRDQPTLAAVEGKAH